MIKGIVFDMDHTLFDRYGTIATVSPDFYRHFADRVSDKYNPESFAKLLTSTDKRLAYIGWKEIFEELVESGVFSNPPEFEEYREFLFNAFMRVSVPFEFTKPMLARLRKKGYKLGIITNGNHDIQHSKIVNLDFTPYFDEIIICGDLGIQKPNPEPFIEMASRLNLKPEELVYVGDNPTFDVDASRKAGYTPIWVKTTGTWQEGIEPSKYEIDDVSEVEDLVEKIKTHF